MKRKMLLRKSDPRDRVFLPGCYIDKYSCLVFCPAQAVQQSVGFKDDDA